MNILFLLSSLEPAGSETYCQSLARAWGNRHRIFWISDRLHFGQTYTSLPISQKAFPGGVRNTWRVRRFIRENQIHLVHSHSRRAHWVAAQAAALERIPHVTTVHQPPPVHLFSRLWPCLGDHTIAIDEIVADHLKQHFSRGLQALSLIRNGIDLAHFERLPLPETSEKTILLLGRLTGGRWQAVEFFFDVLRRIGSSLPPTRFRIAGRLPPDRAEAMREQLTRTNAAIAPSRIEATDFVSDLRTLLTECHGVLGGGRSVLESLACGRPAIVLGERGTLGLFSPENRAEAFASNFGDHLIQTQFYPAILEMALRQLLAGDAPTPEWGRAQVQEHYNLTQVAASIDQIYFQLRSH